LSAAAGDTSDACVSGPARLVPARLRAAAIGARTVETLRRLAVLAERPRRELHGTQG
jgi:hypothetical protein